MDSATLLGTAAGTLTTVALVPQVVRIVRLKAAEEVSAGTFAVMSVGIALWAAYGLLIDSPVVVFFNLVTLGLCLAILVLKHRYRQR
ncbi:MAG: hypothetical protein HY825_01350 [Acidobacteria bacterium]|nr:hypothetical protein [Acidobacteriota bacterium]